MEVGTQKAMLLEDQKRPKTNNGISTSILDYRKSLLLAIRLNYSATQPFWILIACMKFPFFFLKIT